MCTENGVDKEAVIFFWALFVPSPKLVPVAVTISIPIPARRRARM
jgi:hypothetical protein